MKCRVSTLTSTDLQLFQEYSEVGAHVDNWDILTASRYTEYSVIKINRHGQAQPRILGVDHDRIYNEHARGQSGPSSGAASHDLKSSSFSSGASSGSNSPRIANIYRKAKAGASMQALIQTVVKNLKSTNKDADKSTKKVSNVVLIKFVLVNFLPSSLDKPLTLL